MGGAMLQRATLAAVSKMSKSNSQSSVTHNHSSPLRISRQSTTPDEWTLVNEYNIEKKDSYKEWTDTVNSRLCTLKQQLLSYFTILQQLDEEILEEHKKISLLKTTPRTTEQTTPTDTEQTSHTTVHKTEN